MTLYQKFRSSSLDTRDIGLDVGADTSDNVLTPLNAQVIGWGKDGESHFCFVEGFGETVFSVDPNAHPGNQVHPVANDFADFLGLIVACKGTAPLTWISCVSHQRFLSLLEAQKPARKQLAILNALRNGFSPSSVADPYGYVQSLQRSFDYTLLPLHPDYDEHCPIRPGLPKWEVYFGGGFLEAKAHGKPAVLLPCSGAFSWAGEQWQVPAVYQCANGLVLDCCMEIPIQKMRTFHAKWGYLESKPSRTKRERLEMEADRPYPDNIDAILSINGREVPASTYICEYWNPLENTDWETGQVLDHYHCDWESGWMFIRMSFPWKPGKRKSAVRTLSLTLSARETDIPGPQFTTPMADGSFSFTDPTTGMKHELKVLELSHESMDPNFLTEGPQQFTVMRYDVQPPIPESLLRIEDSGEDDPPQRLRHDLKDGIIGGADGPTTIVLSKPADGTRVTVSALHYKPAEQVRWQIIFRQRRRQDIKVSLT